MCLDRGAFEVYRLGETTQKRPCSLKFKGRVKGRARQGKAMASVEILDVRKSFGTLEVIHGVTIDIPDQSFVVLVGPSGCGKSTLLRMIAGLERITGGEILIGDRVVNLLPPRERDIAMVFQNYALYPHMTVFENMGFSLKLRKVEKRVIAERVQEAAEILNLGEFLDRYPRQLSGGQRQRVAMGRAIVRDPQVFLFDEPLSNLDVAVLHDHDPVGHGHGFDLVMGDVDGGRSQTPVQLFDLDAHLHP